MQNRTEPHRTTQKRTEPQRTVQDDSLKCGEPTVFLKFMQTYPCGHLRVLPASLCDLCVEGHLCVDGHLSAQIVISADIHLCGLPSLCGRPCLSAVHQI